jgi:hypothetical protein
MAICGQGCLWMPWLWGFALTHVADRDATFNEQVFNIWVAQDEPVVKHSFRGSRGVALPFSPGEQPAFPQFDQQGRL